MGHGLALWIGAGIAAVALAAIALNTYGGYSGLTVPQVAPATLSGRLKPQYRLTTPEGSGPFPTALLMSGCDGPRDNMRTWSQALAGAGWAALVVDSHTPRGLDDYALWRLVCAGQLLTGGERAGDIAVALADARAMPQVDPARLALIGASHGGWAAMEFLSMAETGQVPHAITGWPDWPEGAAATGPRDGIVAALLLYPYCGTLSRAMRRRWTSPVPVLFLLAEDDTIAPERPCLALASRAAARGLPVRAHVYPGVTHGFDQKDKAPLSALAHSPEATRDALDRGLRFLNGTIGR